MKTNLLKTACAVLGENYTVVMKSSLNAQQKVRNIFLALLIPSLIWAATGFMAAEKVFGMGFWASILVALVFALIVITIDVTFMSVKGFWLIAYRLVIVLSSCLLNSLLFDTSIFEADFKSLAERMQLEEIKKNYRHESELDSVRLHELKAELIASRIITENARTDYLSEADGTGGSRKRGMSSIALGKKAVYEQVKQKHDLLTNEVAELDDQLRKGERIFIDRHRDETIGIQLRVKAMITHLFQQGLSLNLLFPLLFILIILLLEFAPVFVKSMMGTTDYDNWKLIQERQLINIQNLEELRLHKLQQRIGKYQAADFDAIKSLSSIKSRI
jgi:hypothetical protein